MNKTAMQELADLLALRMDGADNEIKNKLDFFHSWVVFHGLPKEKRQIIKAYKSGDGDAYNEEEKWAEAYYNETFKKQ